MSTLTPYPTDLEPEHMGSSVAQTILMARTTRRRMDRIIGELRSLDSQEGSEGGWRGHCFRTAK